MNLKTKYNAFMAEHPLLRGGAWLITRLFMLALVAVLFVLKFLADVIADTDNGVSTDGNDDLMDTEQYARNRGYASAAEMYEKDDHFN